MFVENPICGFSGAVKSLEFSLNSKLRSVIVALNINKLLHVGLGECKKKTCVIDQKCLNLAKSNKSYKLSQSKSKRQYWYCRALLYFEITFELSKYQKYERNKIIP